MMAREKATTAKATYKTSDAPKGKKICMKYVIGKCAGPPTVDCKEWHPPLDDGKKGLCFYYQLSNSMDKVCKKPDCIWQHTAIGEDAAKAIQLKISRAMSPAGRGKGSGQ